MPEPGYEFFEHTADTGLVVRGRTLTELFAHAAKGLEEVLVSDSAIASAETRPVKLEAATVGELFRAWLNELLFWFGTERFVAASCQFEQITETRLAGRVRGERFDSARHAAGVEVKGVTYHQFEVKRLDEGWSARVIFDV